MPLQAQLYQGPESFRLENVPERRQQGAARARTSTNSLSFWRVVVDSAVDTMIQNESAPNAFAGMATVWCMASVVPPFSSVSMATKLEPVCAPQQVRQIALALRDPRDGAALEAAVYDQLRPRKRASGAVGVEWERSRRRHGRRGPVSASPWQSAALSASEPASGAVG